MKRNRKVKTHSGNNGPPSFVHLDFVVVLHFHFISKPSDCLSSTPRKIKRQRNRGKYVASSMQSLGISKEFKRIEGPPPWIITILVRDWIEEAFRVPFLVFMLLCAQNAWAMRNVAHSSFAREFSEQIRDRKLSKLCLWAVFSLPEEWLSLLKCFDSLNTHTSWKLSHSCKYYGNIADNTKSKRYSDCEQTFDLKWSFSFWLAEWLCTSAPLSLSVFGRWFLPFSFFVLFFCFPSNETLFCLPVRGRRNNETETPLQSKPTLSFMHRNN